MDDIFEKLNRIEAKLDEINKLLGVGKEIEDRDKNNKSSNQTTTYDGEIVFKYKPKDNDSDESYMYDINRSI
jgi:hypothetical protein